MADVLPFDHSIREGGDVGSASDIFNFVVPIQLTRQRKLVDRRIGFGQVAHSAEDALMGAEREVLLAEYAGLFP